MPRIQMSLDAATAEALTQFSKTKNISISNAAADILKSHFQYDVGQSNRLVGLETKAYFLRIINTLNQVLMCVYDENKTSIKEESAEACIQKITKEIHTYVEKDRVAV